MKKRIDDLSSGVDEGTLPRISIILPFNRKMKNEAELSLLLSAEADKIKKKLLMTYSEKAVDPVINKLHDLIKDIHPGHAEKSMGIFVSPVAAKVYYFTPSNLAKYDHQCFTTTK